MRVASLLLFISCLLVSALAQVRNVNIQSVVNELGERFENIRNEGLGIDKLEEAYQDAQFTFDLLTDSEIDSMLSDDSLIGRVDTVMELFDNLTTGAFNFSLDTQDCCSSISSESCCNGVCFSDSLLEAFGNFSLSQDEQLLFGHVSGGILGKPAFGCGNIQDSRSQRWFRESLPLPLEVVIMIDLPQNFFPEYLERMRAVAFEILDTLTQQDKVAVVRPDLATNVPPILTRLSSSVEPQLVPVCDDVILDMRQFINTQSELTANYTTGLLTSAGLFSDSPDTRKVLVTIFPGNNPIDITIGGGMLVQELNRRGIQVLVDVYRGLTSGVPGIDGQFSPLAQVSVGGGVDAIILGLPAPANPPAVQELVGPFYAPYLDTTVFTNNSTFFGRSSDDNGADYLVMTRPVYVLDRLAGVLYARLPWEQLLSAGLSQLAGRDSSYLFAIGGSGLLLYHPLLPGDTRKDVLASDIEPDIVPIIDSLTPGSTERSEVTKVELRPSTGARAGFAVQTVRGDYFCRLYCGRNVLCAFVAELNTVRATLNQQSVNVQSVYSSSPNQVPVYSNLMFSAANNETCDYYCKPSLSNRVSFQLTGASQPLSPDSQSLVDELTSYVEGSGQRPSWVEEGLAEDIAIASSVAPIWTDSSSNPSNYITRRHLASPNGVYLTFPPTQFVPDFNPRYTAWYTVAEAHPTLLTLSPPTADPLEEGGRLTVSISYAIKTPLSEQDNELSGGQTLSVVSGDVTLDTLRVFIRQSLPLCEQNAAIDCLIIDDIGNIVYDQQLASSPGYSGGDMFILDPIDGNIIQERRALVINLLANRDSNNDFLRKFECEDFFTPGIEALRFHQLDTSHESAVSQTGAGDCINYAVQRIPGTNAFMVVIEGTSCQTQLCFCSGNGDSLSSCNNCEAFNTGCECPCFCPDCPRRIIPLACPRRLSSVANYELAVPAEASPAQGSCFNQNCNCMSTLDSCLGVRDCSWCPTEQKCVYKSECCDASVGQCCARSPQIERFQSLSCDLGPVCLQGPPISTCPPVAPENNAPRIAAGVVGGIFGVLLVAMIIALFVWYQFFRRDDPEESSRESAFDFSKKKTGVTNPASLEEANSNNGKPGSPTTVEPIEEKKSPLDEQTSL